MSKTFTNIIIHCSDSEWGCVRVIREWHLGRGWRDIGYHFVILNGYVTYEDYRAKRYLMSLDGSIECGRYLNQNLIVEHNEVGAHTLGYNDKSIGICLIGKNIFTAPQFDMAAKLCIELKKIFNIKTTEVLGHYETEAGIEHKKTCPNSVMNDFRLKII